MISMIFSNFASNSTFFYLLNTSIKILEIGITSPIRNVNEIDTYEYLRGTG
jgi:hypothetical protein